MSDSGVGSVCPGSGFLTGIRACIFIKSASGPCRPLLFFRYIFLFNLRHSQLGYFVQSRLLLSGGIHSLVDLSFIWEDLPTYVHSYKPLAMATYPVPYNGSATGTGGDSLTEDLNIYYSVGALEFDLDRVY